MVHPCKCTHDVQDALHGAGRRVHTEGSGKGRDNTLSLHCTVCGDEKKISVKKEGKK